MEGKKKKRYSILRAMSVSSQLGITLSACVLIGVFGGKYLDGLLHTSPWLLLICSILGMIASFRMIFLLAKKNGEKK